MSHSIKRNIFIYAIGSALPKLAALVTLPILTRYLSAHDYGITTSVAAITNVLAIVGSLQLDNAVRRCYFDYKLDEEKKQFLGTILLSVVLLNVLTAALCLACHKPLQAVFPEVPFYPFYVIGILQVTFGSVITIFRILYQAKEKPLLFIVTSLFMFSTTTALLMVFVVGFKMGALGMMLASLIGNLVSLPVAVLLGRKWIVLSWNYAMFRNGLAFGVRTIPYMISSTVLANVDRFLLSRYASTAELGLYGVAFRLASVMQLANHSLMSSYYPLFFRSASEQGSRVKDYLGTISSQLMLMLGLLGFGGLLFSKEIAEILLDAKFAVVASIFPWLIMANMFSAYGGITGLGATYLKKHIWFAWIVMVGGIINIGLNIMLIPLYGAKGAAMATMVSAGSMMILRLACSQYYWPVNFRYRLFLEAGLLGAATLMIVYMTPVSGWHLWPSLAVKILLFLAFCVFVISRLEWWKHIFHGKQVQNI